MAMPSLHRVTATVMIYTTPEAAFDAWLDPRQAVRFLAANTTTVNLILPSKADANLPLAQISAQDSMRVKRDGA